ncbi:PIR protein [Plasmodium brasilianum]|uniref:PIR protein n=1 Tax=Plasmodium brasilianum TaxID=5824 RepID=A0ACB9Y888_PLABR|nr:PIR protein [Plasmodium brasilianum]
MKTEEENDLVDVSKELSKNEKFDKINDDIIEVFCVNILNKLDNLEKDYIKNNNHDFCESCIFYSDGMFDEWREEKYLYYYFKKYKDIKNKQSVSGEKKKYCKYHAKIKSLYKRHIKQCCTYLMVLKNNENMCHKYFNCEEAGYWKTIIEDLIIDRDIMKGEYSLKGTLRNLIYDPFYKGITFGFVVITLRGKNKNKDNFLETSESIVRFYKAKHKKTNWEDNEIPLSYYSV